MMNRERLFLNDAHSKVLTGRLLGVDYGLRRVGLAVCDHEGRIAVGAGRLTGTGPREVISRIIAEAKLREVDGIVIGEPTTTRGNEELLEGVEQLKKALLNRGFKVTGWPEAYTSAAALTARKHFGGKKNSDKSWTDEAAAIILLQDYLAWVRDYNG